MVALIVIASVLAVGMIVYFVEPFLYAFLYSKLIEIFVKNPPYMSVEEVFPESRLLRDNWRVIRE